MSVNLLRQFLYLLSVAVFSLSSLVADTEEQEHAKTHETGDHGHGSHARYKHHAALLIAATSNLDKHHTDFTLGGDYQYRITPRWGVGGFGELIFADHTEWLFGYRSISILQTLSG